jgi:hypothetical protein
LYRWYNCRTQFHFLVSRIREFVQRSCGKSEQ